MTSIISPSISLILLVGQVYSQPSSLPMAKSWATASHLAPFFFANELVMGKTEGRGKDWHGHVTAVTVAPPYRRLGLAKKMMRLLEHASEAQDAFFVDLFVRSSNALAIDMYRSFGYVVYRRVVDYYSSSKGPNEDAFDMRIPLKRDVDKESIHGHGEDNRIEADAFPDYSI
ncbi:acyl-CoA N-acyltransferase [Protomyces lactucae-debilis]|uniref:Acyl-CoA N-acyltransferase n=1 Tax=Protomyces lactucae-debilis TaxID=2754530 RepID=A0A1Y2F6V7_PROLT|nr:acyl-CoA N-acyltransferase [Protomyces lactucae-debilis]ORY79397.1 acyl-CoA N-acyltransferase [Protomyces lactucae-debilis]